MFSIFILNIFWKFYQSASIFAWNYPHEIFSVCDCCSYCWSALNFPSRISCHSLPRDKVKKKNKNEALTFLLANIIRHSSQLIKHKIIVYSKHSEFKTLIATLTSCLWMESDKWALRAGPCTYGVHIFIPHQVRAAANLKVSWTAGGLGVKGQVG